MVDLLAPEPEVAAEAVMLTPPAKLPRVRKWTPHSRTKKYCICRSRWASRPMIQCEGKCQDWYHLECMDVTPDVVQPGERWVCPLCSARGGEWLEEPTYCTCGQPWGDRFMLACEGPCQRWFHGSCVDVSPKQAKLLDSWLCSDCTAKAAESTPCRPLLPAPASASVAALSEDLWAHVLSFLPVATRLVRMAVLSRHLLAAVNASLESWCRSHAIEREQQGRQSSRHGPAGVLAAHGMWVHLALRHGCHGCFDALGEFACKRTSTVRACAFAHLTPAPRVDTCPSMLTSVSRQSRRGTCVWPQAGTSRAGRSASSRRFLLCKRCARRDALVLRLNQAGYDVAMESIHGKPLYPRHFHCPLGAYVDGAPDEL